MGKLDFLMRYAEAGRHYDGNKIADEVMQGDSPSAKVSVLHSYFSNEKHVAIAIHDESAYVRGAAALHSKATKEHLDTLLQDHNEVVRSKAARNPNLTSDQIHKAMNDPDTYVQAKAAANPSATPEHIEMALTSRHPEVRMAAMRHDSISRDRMIKFRDEEPDSYIRSVADAQLMWRKS